MKIIICALFLLLASAIAHPVSHKRASHPVLQKRVFDLSRFGARSNGDITQALTKAWAKACHHNVHPVMIYIRKGKYRLGDIKLTGPCKAPQIELVNNGIIEAPGNMKLLHNEPHWIRVQYVNNFILSGHGVFDGVGPAAYRQNDCHTNVNCKMLTMNFGFYFLNNSQIRDITSKDSKNFHINIFGSDNVVFNNVKINAPGDSPNTDGIHIGRSQNIKIYNTHIKTGDDCISLGDGSVNITVDSVTCGPGHGISVGSVGRHTNELPIENVIVRNCKLTNTQNGVRIKTWPAAPGTITITKMHFENIMMTNVSNPVIIDQEYCPWNQCNKKIPSKVKISDVTFKNIRGTSGTMSGVTLICSAGVPCQNVKIHDVNLKFQGKQALAQCSNARPSIIGFSPACLKPSAFLN